jgi:hypothetical protein
MDRRLGGPQNRSGRGGGEKISQSLVGLQPPIIQPVAELSYHGSLYQKTQIYNIYNFTWCFVWVCGPSQ